MPDIETQIFRLELDGSAYIAGADKLSASTTKLSDAQEKANVKLAELQKSQNNYKKVLEETTAVIKANEKETIELTKDLNLLKESGKGASVEAEKLKAALRGIATSTKEFKSEAVELKNNLNATTAQIKVQTKELQAAEKANTGFTSGLQKTYTGLSKIAALIPGLGIGSLIAIISGPVINAFGKWFDSINAVNLAAAKQKQLLDDIFKDAGKSAGADIAHLEVLRSVITNLNEPLNKRLAAVREYNTLADEGNKIDEKQIDNINLINSAISRQIEQIGKLSIAKAFENKLGEEAAKIVELELQLKAKKPVGQVLEATGFDPNNPIHALERQIALEKEVRAENPQLVKDIETAKKAFQDLLDFSRDFIDFGDTVKPPKKGKTKAEAQAREILNIYADELQKLAIEIAKLQSKGFTTEESITKGIDEDFKKRSAAFKKAVDKGQLTKDQAADLNEKLNNIKKLVTVQSIKAFNDQRAALLQQIDSELSNIEQQSALKRISNIQDSFERQRQAIVFESDKLISTREQARDKEILQIQKSTILTPAEIEGQVVKVNLATDQFIEQVKIHTNQKLQQLSFDTFEKLSDDLQRRLKDKNLGISALSLIDIQEQTELLQTGKISYAQYQKELTRIAKEESDKRREAEIANLRVEIGRRQAELRSNANLTEAQGVQLLDEIRSRQAQIDNIQKGDKVDAPTKRRIDSVQQYAQAIGSVVNSVVSFWQAANAAESEALDRSIELQEKRVSAALRIAERGNAQYLKAEEDRLRELQIKRENAARKQLGIDAALQASQILVGITGAIAKIATPGIGIAETIGSIAIIVGALATGYGLVKSLQGNQPTFFTGTKDTGRGGSLDGKGGFAATLHPNEAVIPSDKNKAYHPAVAAIYDGTIPAEHLNAFVKNYHQIKAVPMPNYQRIKEAAELSIGSDGRMHLSFNEQNKLIMENNDLQRATLRALKSMGVSVNMDKNGIAVSVMEVVEQMEINSRI